LFVGNRQPSVNAITFWTAGSFLIPSTIFWTESFMAGKEDSLRALHTVPKGGRWVTVWGKKPLES